MGAVCKKHEEFYETACRWCVPEEPGLRARLGDKDLSIGFVPKGPSAAAAPPPVPVLAGSGYVRCACQKWNLAIHCGHHLGWELRGVRHAMLACVPVDPTKAAP